MKASDRLYIQATVQLAEGGRFTCAPNPTVGCIITRNGQVIGRGYHQYAGQGHAEINAIADAGGDVQGATVYVSLEPCSFFGQTPACAQTLIDAGVARVVIGILDPNPRVAGSGVAMLEAANIKVTLLDLAEARACIAGFAKRITSNRPLVRLKTASSIDGAIALANGESQWITGPSARADVQYWRARSDAVITGVGTVIADDPQLNVRDANYAHCHQPLRVVLDSTARTPSSSKLLRDGQPTLLIHSNTIDISVKETEVSIEDPHSVSRLYLKDGPSDLAALLDELGNRGCNEVLVEAGPGVVGSFLQANLWDEWICYLAPKALGRNARQLADFNIEKLADSIDAKVVDQARIGDDVRLTLRPTSK
ncbi:MAG: bifunctional diaminohydroxyphosphoribosylaminopyrimidine deaminase/5-amino-6-(5-phosphoribosylamino)uracil reductase RibD [Gammaproteobacteria bacterium]|nr:bifunctional diaminohydroxyphosphoribosylaminopyrimidine deaminase/5-amino-6-(5-phosphoribosylamino)uracil reductase RibD [Gammaproteobacteria bacterium]